MKKILILFLSLGGCFPIYSQAYSDADDADHSVVSTFFYRSHKEDDYKYNASGLGLEYQFHAPHNLNAKLKSLITFQDKNFLTENELELSYPRELSTHFFGFPVFSKKIVLHHFKDVDDLSFWAQKGTAYLGVGFGGEIDGFSLQAQLEGFKDVMNKMTVKSLSRDFYGKFFSNPYGYRVKSLLKARTVGNNWISVEAFYANTFDESYEEHGLQFNLEWGF